MLAVRCGLLVLALLAGARAERCTYAEYGVSHGDYPVRFGNDYPGKSIDLQLPFEEAGCNSPIGSWVNVCVDDDVRPDVTFYDVRTFHIERHHYVGGNARVRSGGFCRYPVHTHHSGLGAANLTPKVVHLKGKN